MKPGGAPSSPRLARRGGVGLRRQGYALMEVLLFVVIATTLTVTVMRSVKPTTVAENNIAKIMMAGLENLMQAHQLTKPSCIDLVNNLNGSYQTSAEWCWLFVADPAKGLYPITGFPNVVYNPATTSTAYPTRMLSDFWGASNGTVTGQGKFRLKTGTDLNLLFNSGLSLQIGLTASQIKSMDTSQCMNLMNSLALKIAMKGFPFDMGTAGTGTIVIASQDASSQPAFMSKFASFLNSGYQRIYKPDDRNLNKFIFPNYCSNPASGSFDYLNTINVYFSY